MVTAICMGSNSSLRAAQPSPEQRELAKRVALAGVQCG